MPNMESDVAISVNALTKKYRLYNKPADRVKEALSIRKKSYHCEFVALDNINFTVKKGETVGIIGSNGAGKSTLLKIITGIMTASYGDATVNGRVSALLELGTGFNPDYTGIENIELNGKVMGYSKKEIEDRKEGIIRFADIGEYIYQPVKNYSSGMFARLAFAVAISIEPDILIVDEALSVGDIFFQNKCFQKFEELKKKNTSILFVSHDISTVRKMCTNVLWLENGKQMMFGKSHDVCNAYFDSQMMKIRDNENCRPDENNAETSNTADAPIVPDSFSLPIIRIAENSLLSDKVEIVSAYITDVNGNFVRVLNVREKYRVGVAVKFFASVENAIIGFSAANSKGIIVFSSNSYITLNAGLQIEKGETVVVEMEFECPRVRSGAYEISPAVALGTQENHSILTWLHGVIGVDVEGEKYEIGDVGIDCAINVRRIIG